MKSISQTTQQMESISKKTSAFFRRYHVGQILRAANACKLKGFSSILVFLVLVSIIFENRSLYMQRRLHEDSLPFGKDTAYRFLNSCHTNWRKFTLLLAARIINETIKPLTDAGRRCAIVVDDSLFSRSRSKRVELLANVYDHVSRRYTKGFRLLVLGWTDGNTFLPLTFCLLSTSKEKNRLNEASASVDARSNGGKQRKLAQIRAEREQVDAELERVKAAYPVIWKDPNAKPELCFVGCPHLTLEQLRDWTEKLSDALRQQGRLTVAVPTVFTAAPAVLKAFENTVEGYKLQSMGVILSYICPLMYMNNPLCKKKAVITCSNKLRTYTSARYYTEAEILDIITGKEGK